MWEMERRRWCGARWRIRTTKRSSEALWSIFWATTGCTNSTTPRFMRGFRRRWRAWRIRRMVCSGRWLHKLDHTTVYEGIPEALAGLAHSSNGVQRQMAVLSNKPVNPSRLIVQALGLGDFFVSVYGGNSFTTKKPD